MGLSVSLLNQVRTQQKGKFQLQRRSRLGALAIGEIVRVVVSLFNVLASGASVSP